MSQTTERIPSTPMQAQLKAWGLSDHAIAILSKEPEIVAHLQQARSLPPFPPGYVPDVIEELFDDLLYRRWEFGCTTPTYLRPCPPTYEPPFVEYSFDDETAFFHIQGEIVVNRIGAMAKYATRLGWLTK